jgi:flavin reductase (DIM6/NTAB) family NADH-FMN oxidoreductase RutF
MAEIRQRPRPPITKLARRSRPPRRPDRKQLVEHSLIDPAILYFGTPVVLLSTIAENGTTNTAPMSSVFWLGQTAVLGMGSRSQTAQNLLATGECVINLPSVDLVTEVDALALTTGRSPFRPAKRTSGIATKRTSFITPAFTADPGTLSGRNGSTNAR